VSPEVVEVEPLLSLSLPPLWSDKLGKVPPTLVWTPAASSSSSIDGVEAGYTLILERPQGRPLLCLLVASSARAPPKVSVPLCRGS
jgi:hypothetical protein